MFDLTNFEREFNFEATLEIKKKALVIFILENTLGFLNEVKAVISDKIKKLLSFPKSTHSLFPT